MLQVLGNVVGNAIKFTPTQGEILIRVARAGGDIQFSVVDNGPGVPAEQRKAIFERFWQGEATDRRGLGLSISKSIVDAHGGRIWIDSAHRGGSCFSFTVPAAN